jgi:hypothetical protein
VLGPSKTQSGLSKGENAERKYELRARIQQLLSENELSLAASSEPVSKKSSKVQVQPRVGARSVLIDRPNQVSYLSNHFTRGQLYRCLLFNVSEPAFSRSQCS